MKVYHVKGKELEEIPETENYEFKNGDVYVVDTSVDSQISNKVFVWLGSQCCVDEKAVGAWAAHMLDIDDPEIDIDTVVEGQESDEFKQAISVTVITGDTPGFLEHVDVNAVDVSYAMYWIRDTDLTDDSSWDDLKITNVPINKDSLTSGDVYVIDGYNALYVWVGAESQSGEKAAGNRLVRKFDVDRKRNPLVYVVHEGREPTGFFELLKELGSSDKEDIRVDDAEEISEGIIETVEEVQREESVEEEIKSSPADSVLQIYFCEGEFLEKCDPSKADATLSLNRATQEALLTFEEGSSLIAQRTAGRQARGICKSGFRRSDGSLFGGNFVLKEVSGEQEIADRLLQEGHKYS